MKELIIIGAGGFGREVLGYALDMIAFQPDLPWKIKGFIDDNKNSLKEYNLEYDVIETISDHKVNENNVYICAIGDPKIKFDICKRFIRQGAEFVNIIHPSARIGRTCNLGIGDVICPNAVLTENVTVGDFVAINCHSNCGHDSIVGDGCTLSVFCDVTGFVQLSQCVFMGSHASICPGNKIGEYSKLGAGVVVISDIPSNVTAIGVPAKVIK